MAGGTNIRRVLTPFVSIIGSSGNSAGPSRGAADEKELTERDYWVGVSDIHHQSIRAAEAEHHDVGFIGSIRVRFQKLHLQRIKGMALVDLENREAAITLRSPGESPLFHRCLLQVVYLNKRNTKPDLSGSPVVKMLLFPAGDADLIPVENPTQNIGEEKSNG